MATVTRSDEPLAVAGWTIDDDQASKSDRYLARRLAAAAAEVRRVALLTFVLAAVLAVLGWFTFGALVEHWLTPRGLPTWARWAWFLTGAVGLAVATVKWILPIIRYRVNLVYAARAIETDHPELRNDLVNTVLVKASAAAGTTPRVARTLERRAARELSRLPADEAVVDRGLALRLAVGLLLLVALASVYELLSPKSLVASAVRLVAPWAGLAPPARVRIGVPQCSWRHPGEDAALADDSLRWLDHTSGTVTLTRGRQLVVTAEIRGLSAEDRPSVLATPLRDDDATPDGRGWRVPMSTVAAKSAGGPSRYRAVLPDASRGLEQGMDLVIAAGDAQTARLRVAVVDTPSVLVREVRYQFPAYTGLPDETVAWQGDLRAVEGTRATLLVEGNHPLKSAWIDLDCDGRPNKELKVAAHDLSRASGGIDLLLTADRSGPAHTSYRLMFTPRSSTGASDSGWLTEKLEYRIDVVPDLAPEVSIEEPRQALVSVPPAAPVTIRVRALDPDFGLARVLLETRVRGGEEAGAPSPHGPLLDVVKRGTFEGVVTIVPGQLGVEPGGVLEYRAVAIDTRPHEPNVTTTPWQGLKVDPRAVPLQPEQPPTRAPAESGDGQGEAVAPDGGNTEGKDVDPQDDGASRTPAAAQSDDRAGGNGRDGEGRDGVDQPPGGSQDDHKQERMPPADGEQRGRTGDRDGATEPANSGDRGAGEGPQRGTKREKDAAAGGNAATSGDAARDRGKPGRAPQEPPESMPSAREERPQAGRGREQMAPGAEAGEGPASEDGAAVSPSERRAEGAESSQRDQRDAAGSDAAGSEAAGRSDGGRRDAVPADGTNDGEAVERILDHKRDQQPSRNDKQPPSRPQPGADASPATSDDPGGQGERGGRGLPEPVAGGEQPAGESGDAERGAGNPAAEGSDQAQSNEPGTRSAPNEPSQGERNGPEKSGDGTPQPSSCSGADGKPCGNGNCPSCGGGAAGTNPGQGQPGQGQPGQGQPGQGQPGQGQPGQGQPGQGQPGQGQPGQGQPGQGQPGQGQPGHGQPGQAQPGQGQPGQAQPGQGQPGQGQPGQGQTGQAQPGQAQPGQGQPGQGQPGQGQPGHGQPGQGQPGQGQPGQGQPGQGQPGQGGKEGAAHDPDGEDGSGVEAARLGGGQPRDAVAADGQELLGRELEWGDQDLAHARNAADLAIEHLRDSVASGRRDLLDALGWTPEQAEAFLARWEAMRQLAGSDDPRQRREFEQTLRSLGLRPDGVRSSRDVPRDVQGGAVEGRRGRPPASYRDQFKAYLQGTTGE